MKWMRPELGRGYIYTVEKLPIHKIKNLAPVSEDFVNEITSGILVETSYPGTYRYLLLYKTSNSIHYSFGPSKFKLDYNEACEFNIH